VATTIFCGTTEVFDCCSIQGRVGTCVIAENTGVPKRLMGVRTAWVEFQSLRERLGKGNKSHRVGQSCRSAERREHGKSLVR
jgi:hypothetical protein